MRREIRFGSVCSGIEAASVAWHPLGWSAAWLSEIEPFPSAVLAHHYPDVPNLGDMTTLPKRILLGEVEAPDLFCGGTPCQAFSVAGLRRSLDDARGNLSLTFCEIADAIDHVRSVRGEQPTIVFWENVPGVLSTKDNAFGCFLAGLAGEDGELVAPGGKWANAGCVYGPSRAVAWRVFDAQYFGVAQRRRRVFVVASARDGFDPAAVLFEFDGVRRDTAPRREAGKAAPTIPARSTAGGGLGTDFDCDGGLQVVGSLACNTGPNGHDAGNFACNQAVDAGHVLPVITMAHGQGGAEIAENRSPTLTCNHEAPIAAYTTKLHNTASNQSGKVYQEYATSLDANSPPPAVFAPMQHTTHTLRGEGFDASEDGTLRASTGGGDKPHVLASAVDTLYNKGIVTLKEGNASTQETYPGTLLRALRQEVGAEAFAKWGLGILDSLQQAEVLRQALHGLSIRPASFSRSWVVHCSLSRQEDGSGWLLQSLRETGCEGCPPQGWEPPEQLAGELRAYLSELSQPGAQASRFMRDLWWASQGAGLLREALSAVQEMGRSAIYQGKPIHSSKEGTGATGAQGLQGAGLHGEVPREGVLQQTRAAREAWHVGGSSTEQIGGRTGSMAQAMMVRRLTCEEAEFLQGFPRGYTAIPWRKKPASECPDGPRYRALGNSWAVPVVRWIGSRIHFHIHK